MATFQQLSWPGCRHVMFSDAHGAIINGALLPLGSNYISSTPNWPCPACAYPNKTHPDVSTVMHDIVVPRSSLDPTSAIFQPGQSESQALVTVVPAAASSTLVPPVVEHSIKCHCPTSHPNCHGHYSVDQACHLWWLDCPLARKAAAATYHSRGRWNHSPRGFHEAHAVCLAPGPSEDRCPFHNKLYLEALPTVKQPKRLNWG